MGPYVGVKYVRKARCWCFYITFNRENSQDIREWFNSEEEALKRLEEEKEKRGIK